MRDWALQFRAFIYILLGIFLLATCLDGLRRGVTIFNIRRAEAPWRFWPLVMAQILIFSAILLYGVVQDGIARGGVRRLMALLERIGL